MNVEIDKTAIRKEQRRKLFDYLDQAMNEGSVSCFMALVNGFKYPDISYDLAQCQLQMIRDVLLSKEAAAAHPHVREWLDYCLNIMTQKEAAKRELAAASKALEELTNQQLEPDETPKQTEHPA